MDKNPGQKKLLIIILILIVLCACCTALIFHKTSHEEHKTDTFSDVPIRKGSDTVNVIVLEASDNVRKEVTIKFPWNTRTQTADVIVTNAEGYKYNYRLYLQSAGYSDYSSYLRSHGCSTCALTTILGAVSDKFADTTPDKVLKGPIYEMAGDNVFSTNFGKTPKKQMPISLYGMTRVFDRYGIKYCLPSTDPSAREKEITAWLRNGDPVIVSYGKGDEGHLSDHHTILLLGIDSEGYVIIGDSLHKSKTYWGSDGLVKHGRLKVADILSFIKKDNGWTINEKSPSMSHYFYKSSADRGYLMVKADADNNH